MPGEPSWRALLSDHVLPAAVVDLDALDRNVDRLVEALGPEPKTLRIASKSVRHPGLLRRILARCGARARGLLCYSAGEAALLADEGFDDLLIAYPLAQPGAARIVAELAARGIRVWATIDSPEQVQLLAQAAQQAHTTVELCLDVDLSWRLLGGAAHLGVRRSPVRSGADAARLAEAVAQHPSVQLTAVMAYEAQIAGVQDHNPASKLLDPVRRLIKGRSRPLAVARRREVLEALEGAGVVPEIVNGGGTGSVAFTAADPSVTEVAAGSGFLCPHLFDGYHGLELEPAAFFALPVVRSSDPDHVTCFGGGYVASGAPGADRLPVVHHPAGLEPVSLEGFGEVQTPMRWRGQGPAPGLGEPVICRHAKAGELAERFASYLLVRGGRIEAEEPTYRGLGGSFG